MSGPRPIRATYRLQLGPGFGFDQAADLVGYLADLGVSHLYLSPILQAAPGSTHGYDVRDHGSLSAEAGGRAGFDRLVAAAHGAGLGLIADLVPNHVGWPVPESDSAPVWAVLRDGPSSPFARWFDIDWAAAGGRLVVPILGEPVEDLLARGELTVADDGGPDGDEPVVRYADHEFPVRAGTETLPTAELIEAQHWALAYWRDAPESLNYRRFFDVTGLLAVRVEDPEVFDATHSLIVELARAGALDGLRIDHPDGLADPRGYLRRLRAAVGPDCWIVVEKILEGQEQLPSDWPCDGTTGYDALERINSAMHAAAGAEALTRLWERDSGDRSGLAQVIDAAEREVCDHGQRPEVDRLVRLLTGIVAGDRFLRTDPDLLDPARLRAALVALLTRLGRYRAYVVPGEPTPLESARVIDAAARAAADVLAADEIPALMAIRDLVAQRPLGDPMADPGARRDLVVRFQQVSGPVMAKGIEDTAFYRWLRLISLNEVGGDPERMGRTAAQLADHFDAQARAWPATMTTLSTHDTKRSEDVRARLAVLSHRPHEWQRWLDGVRPLVDRPHGLDGATEVLIWQTLVGAWPLTEPRLAEFLTKAVREAKVHTNWTDVDEPYEAMVHRYAASVLADPAVGAAVTDWLAQTADLTRAITLAQKLIQLTMPGVPDVYQGAEALDLSLVDPDNRRPVDHAGLRERLSRLVAGGRAADLADLADEKLWLTRTALTARAADPAVFATSPVSAHDLGPGVIALGRGDRERPDYLVVAALAGPPTGAPDGPWSDLLSGRAVDSLDDLAALLAQSPVALLARRDDQSDSGSR